MKIRKTIVCATLLGLGCAGPTLALDPRFQDANGDMVADAPTDPKMWLDPATLVFAYTPVEDPTLVIGDLCMRFLS